MELYRASQPTAFTECPLFTEEYDRSNGGSITNVQQCKLLSSQLACTTVSQQTSGAQAHLHSPVLTVDTGKFLWW